VNEQMTKINTCLDIYIQKKNEYLVSVSFMCVWVGEGRRLWERERENRLRRVHFPSRLQYFHSTLSSFMEAYRAIN